MKLIVVFSICFLLSAPCFSQQVKYDVLKAEPNYADFYWAVSGNMFMNMHGKNAKANLFLGIETTLKYFPKNLPANLFIRKSLVPQASVIKISDDIKSLGWFEATAGFSVKKTVTRNTKVVLSSSRTSTGDGGYTETTKFIKVPAQHIRSVEFHIGLLYFRDFMKWGRGEVKTKDGTILTSGITNYYIRAIPLGVSSLDQVKIVIDAKEWGECRNAKTVETYFDILILASLKIDGIVQNYTDPAGNTFTASHILKDDSYNAFESKKWGWRAGMRIYPGSSLGLFMATEFGAMPGTPVSGRSDNVIVKSLDRAYFTATMGLSLQLLLEKLFKEQSKQKDEK